MRTPSGRPLLVLMGAAALILGTLSGVSATAAPTPHAPHHFPGRLVFLDFPFDGSPSTLWTVLPGSSHATQIVHAKVPIIAAAISPRGDQIVFNRDRYFAYTGARDQLLLARPDGSHRHVIHAACAGSCHWFDETSWAPDGKTLLMYRCLGLCPRSGYHSFYAVWSIRTDGTHLRQLTFPGEYTHRSKLNDHQPQMAPDGRSFVFDRLDDATGHFTMEIAPITGGAPNAIPLRSDLNPGDPRWTPDGSRILFQAPAEPTYDAAQNLYTIRPNGHGLRQITHYEVPPGQHFGGLFHPSFSPDGRYIAASHTYSTKGQSYLILSATGRQLARIYVDQVPNEISWGPRS
jgi:Tol biopolymer transport system component